METREKERKKEKKSEEKSVGRCMFNEAPRLGTSFFLSLSLLAKLSFKPTDPVCFLSFSLFLVFKSLRRPWSLSGMQALILLGASSQLLKKVVTKLREKCVQWKKAGFFLFPLFSKVFFLKTRRIFFHFSFLTGFVSQDIIRLRLSVHGTSRCTYI